MEMIKNGLTFAVKPQVSEAYRKSVPIKGVRSPKLHLKKNSTPNCALNPTKGAVVQSAPYKVPAGAGPAEPPRRRGIAYAPAPHRDTLPMFPSMETFLMRVEGERQNLLGGVAMPRSRRLGRGTCRNTAVPAARGCSVNLAPAGPAL